MKTKHRSLQLELRFLLLTLTPGAWPAHAAPGDVDLLFDASPGVNGTVRAIAGQTDGKLLVGGAFGSSLLGGKSRDQQPNTTSLSEPGHTSTPVLRSRSFEPKSPGMMMTGVLSVTSLTR